MDLTVRMTKTNHLLPSLSKIQSPLIVRVSMRAAVRQASAQMPMMMVAQSKPPNLKSQSPIPRTFKKRKIYRGLVVDKGGASLELVLPLERDLSLLSLREMILCASVSLKLESRSSQRLSLTMEPQVKETKKNPTTISHG